MYPVYNYSEKVFESSGKINDFIDFAFDRGHAKELIAEDVEFFEVLLCKSESMNILQQLAELIDACPEGILIRDDSLYLLAYFAREDKLPVFDRPLQSIAYDHQPIGKASSNEEALKMLNSLDKTYLGSGVVKSDNRLGYFPAEDKWF